MVSAITFHPPPAFYILVLDQGALAEHDAHAALLERNGVYARLFRLQADKYEPNEGDTT